MKKLLIANRGEIAVRVIRTAREMGIATVAVYSEADQNSMHVKLADEAIAIGASEPTASYLNIERIIAAAKDSGADAIHPGYGFLSEREEFSRACRDAGIIFVGPPPEAMRKLGAKIEAKQLAVEANVPITPGYFRSGADQSELEEEARKIGYPVMLKASAGGGGRGMRVVADPADFGREFKLAAEEALKAFGDQAMMVEKLVVDPRHIEVQFVADSHGNVACLFERECSIQRRHQKLIEEAPSVVLTAKPALWDSIRESVQRLAKAAGYVGAGTAEFIYDRASESFYFLEVNARLQVEHPVTEAITGLDLVRCQLDIADGKPLDLPEDLLNGIRTGINGHAIEVRVIAENPAMNFMPSIGMIRAWAEPKGPGIRIDTGFGTGAEITRYYDSLIAKVIVHASTRSDAIDRLRGALLDFHVLGVRTNIEFILDVIEHPSFRAGDFDTNFLKREFSDWSSSTTIPPELGDLIALATSSGPSGERAPVANQGVWSSTDGWRIHKNT